MLEYKEVKNMGIKMNNNNFSQKLFNSLQEKIEIAQKENRPIKEYVQKQIEILQESHDEFILQAKSQGYEMNNPKVGEIEVRQYSAMKQLAQKIGLPVEKYAKMIYDVQVRIFGEENAKRFFGEQK